MFGNSASEDAQFYEALVDRPKLQYILTPHEGPGAAMAAGYVKASGEPAIVMQAGSVGLMNAMGQIFNAWKEQTPLVVYSYRTDQSRRAGRDGFEEIANQEQIAQPITKYTWLSRRADMIPETVRRAFKAAWTPPFGPSLHLLAFRLQRRAGAHRHHPAGAVRPAHAGAAEPGRGRPAPPSCWSKPACR